MGRDIFEIASLLIGVSVIALLVGHSKQTVEVAQGTASAFGGLLRIVTLQNNFGNPLAS